MTLRSQTVTAKPHAFELMAELDNRSQSVTASDVVRWRFRALNPYCGTRGALYMNEGTTTDLEPLIFTVRNQRVVLDADLARLYGIRTFRFNEAFKRNRQRFPPDFAFQLTAVEFDNLRSQIAISSSQAFDSLKENRSQSATASHGGRRYLPWAFTEHGALMAANILRSERAVQMSVFVVRAFIRLREHVAANTAVVARLAEIDKTLLQHDAALRDLYRKLLPLLQPPADPPRRRIGFHRDDT
jgi:ORF6N domain